MDELEAKLMQQVSAKAHNETHGMDNKSVVVEVAELESRSLSDNLFYISRLFFHSFVKLMIKDIIIR